MFFEWISFLLVGVAALGVSAGLASMSSLRSVRNLVIAGAFLRIVGVLARHAMIYDLYDGASDAVGYFNSGRDLAVQFRGLDFSVIGSGQFGDREWGTQAVRYISGIVVALVGPSVRAAFLVFSLAAFIGLVYTAIAFGRANTRGSMPRAALLLFFWPTLWFWPSSIGKEAVLLLAVGLVTFGYVGQKERIHWLPMVSGLALALTVRPHVAAVLAVSTCVAEWTSHEWTVRRVAQSVLASVVAIWLITEALGMLGLAGADLGTLQAFVVQTAGQTNQGGSAFARAGAAMAIPMAFVNILCRPFITEVNSPLGLVSSLEMMGFWALVIHNRRNLWSALRSWRTNRLTRFSIPFALLYSLMIGVTFQNFGIIARQRTLVMPALLLMLAAASVAASRRTAIVPRRRSWRTPPPGTMLVST